MVGMTKLILLMSLAAVFFFPLDGVEANKCGKSEGKGGETTVECPPPHFCFTETDIEGKLVSKGCTDDKKEKESTFTGRDKKDGCSPLHQTFTQGTETVSAQKGKICFSSPTASASGRLRGQSSSVLSLCVVPIFITISFFGKL